MNSQFYGMVVAGGAGTRLWPISRARTPKQLLSLSSSGQSLLQDAFVRLARSMPPERILTVTSTNYAEPVLAQVQSLFPQYPSENLMLEPVGRDSAAAVLWGMLRLHHLAPEAIVAVIWSDLSIRSETAFDDALRRGYEAVKDGGLVAIGVRPTRPASHLGYIQYGQPVCEGVYEVERFIEKPPVEVAEHLIGEGSCVWNAGIFVFNVRTLLDEFQRLAPNMIGHFREHETAGKHGGWSDPATMEAVYRRLPKASFDHLILEKTDQLRIVPAELEWSDLGAWDEIYFQEAKDPAGNALHGNVLTVDTQNSYIRAGNRLVAAVGVEELVVVDTDDSILVASMAKAHEVKRLVEMLQDTAKNLAEGHEQSVRPWGSYTVLGEGPGFKIKLLEVKPHQKMSLQMHRQRAEHWVVMEGQVMLTCDDVVRECGPNAYFHVPQGARHRIDNQSDGPVRIIEVQFGSYLGEDDIVRFEDVYGRT